MNYIKSYIISFFTNNNKEWAISIVSAIMGAILTLIITIVWDNHKNKKKYKSLLKILFSELIENQKRANSVIKKLSPEIQKRIEEGNMDEGIFIPEGEVLTLDWTFPKPYTIDAWKTFISSGFAIELPSKLFQKIYKIYDSIDSINFLSNLSINIFQILSQPNKLDEKTNKNFDQFCKFGTRSLEVILSKNIDQVINDLTKIVK